MIKQCTQCSHPTNRHDNLCPNCYYADPESDNPQSLAEALTIETYKYTCKCGEARTPVLILMCKGGPGLLAGKPRTNRPGPRDSRALMATDSSLWYTQCQNCNQAFNRRPPGRPKKYTDAERKWSRNNYPKIYRANLLHKIVQSYGYDGQWPECVACMQPATRVLYIGEFGKAPLGNQYWYCRKLAITDPHWHSQFLPYCDHHEVSNIGTRMKQKRQIQAEQEMEALSKSSRTLAELEHR